MKKVKLALKHPFLSGSAVMVGGSMAANGVNYVYHFIMGRTLGVADYGTLAALYSLIYILSIVPASSSLAIVKFISSADTKKEQIGIYLGVKKFILRFAIFFSIIILVLSPFIAKFLNISDTISVLLIAPVFFFTILSLVNQSTLQGLMNFIGVVGPNFVASVVKLVVGLALVLLGFAVGGAMVGVVMGGLLAFIYSKTLIKKSKLEKGKAKLNSGLFVKFALPVLLQSLAFTSFFSSDVILVKHFFSPHEAGLYAALSTLGKIIFFAAQPITGVMFPIISTRHSKGEKYIKVLLMSLLYTLGICFSALFVFLFLPKFAFILYGSEFLEVADKLVWMGIFISIYTIASLLTNFFLSIGKVQIIVLPITAAIAQIATIWFMHESLLQVIQVSTVIMIALCLALSLYLVYNSSNRGYGKAK